ncbi:hypothetical protein BN1723_006089 [Verticillium longisporum]|uniref:Uncharacterized protein n=1 Tax=Verticillium longisporum TaxID=100787 RepID=A0A0G4NDM5_VERLO|nr:hypothetical protein BN1723_006089 [Verticillium longisporum]
MKEGRGGEMDDAEKGGGSDGEEKDVGTEAKGGRRSRSGRAWNDGELSSLRAQWSEPLGDEPRRRVTRELGPTVAKIT